MKRFCDSITNVDSLNTVAEAEQAFEKVWEHIGAEADKPQFTSSEDEKEEELFPGLGEEPEEDEDDDW